MALTLLLPPRTNADGLAETSTALGSAATNCTEVDAESPGTVAVIAAVPIAVGADSWTDAFPEASVATGPAPERAPAEVRKLTGALDTGDPFESNTAAISVVESRPLATSDVLAGCRSSIPNCTETAMLMLDSGIDAALARTTSVTDVNVFEPAV